MDNMKEESQRGTVDCQNLHAGRIAQSDSARRENQPEQQVGMLLVGKNGDVHTRDQALCAVDEWVERVECSSQ